LISKKVTLPNRELELACSLEAQRRRELGPLTRLDGWSGAATLELTPADLDEIARAIKRTGTGTGPSRPNLELAEHRDIA
jgi:hypothetical protein